MDGFTHLRVDIELQTHDPDAYFVLRDLAFLRGASSYVVWVEVRSRGFAGRQRVDFHVDRLAAFADAIAIMDRTLRGTARLQADFEDHFVEFSMTSNGGVFVRGELYEYSEVAQRLRFAFYTDQTCLAPLREHLAAALREAE